MMAFLIVVAVLVVLLVAVLSFDLPPRRRVYDRDVIVERPPVMEDVVDDDVVDAAPRPIVRPRRVVRRRRRY